MRRLPRTRDYTGLLLICGAAHASLACGSSETDGDSSGENAAASRIALISNAASLQTGKNVIRFRVTDAAGHPESGLADQLTIHPFMEMAEFGHGNPVPSDAVRELADAGTYEASLFFTMPSVNGDGMKMGDWSLRFALGDANLAELPVTVSMAMGTDTTHVWFRNEADKILQMGQEKLRGYVFFKDSLTADGRGRHTLRLFAATVQEGYVAWPPLVEGLELVAQQTGKLQVAVNSFALRGGLDGDTEAEFTCDGTARCEATLTGLQSKQPRVLYLQFELNGQPYTTDGGPPDSESDPDKSNRAAAFKLTPDAN
jgi:hypothetical protein